MMLTWHEVADILATAMSHHDDKGICTLTENEHAALAVYVEAGGRVGRVYANTVPNLGQQIIAKGGQVSAADRAIIERGG